MNVATEEPLRTTFKHIPINQRFAHLIGNPDGADFWFDILLDDNRVPAHKLFVAAGSEVLRNIVYGREEVFVKAVDHTSVDDITTAGFLEILRFIYTDQVHLTEENSIEIMKKANYYGLDLLESKCGEFVKKMIRIDNCLCIFSQLYALMPFESISQICLNQIRSFPKSSILEQMDFDFTYCDAEVLKIILSCDVINCDECFLFEALLKWARAQCILREIKPSPKELRTICNRLENCIRWTTLTEVELERLLSLEVGFFDANEVDEMKLQIRHGKEQGIAKRKMFFFQNANWITQNVASPLPPDAIYVGNGGYVARTVNPGVMHAATFFPKYHTAYKRQNIAVDVIQVLCGSGYEWKPFKKENPVPENAVTTDVVDNLAFLICRYQNAICFTQMNMVQGTIIQEYERSSLEIQESYILVASSVLPTLPMNTIPPEAILIGHHGASQHPVYLGRAYLEGDLLPATIVPAENHALVPWNCVENVVGVYAFLRLNQETVEWKASSNGRKVSRAVEGGHTSDGEFLYFGRSTHQGHTVYGKVHRSHRRMYFGKDGVEMNKEEYEVLVFK